MSGDHPFGDNLKILREYVPDASVDLIYLDPPFNSSATYGFSVAPLYERRRRRSQTGAAARGIASSLCHARSRAGENAHGCARSHSACRGWGLSGPHAWRIADFMPD
jgi:hypothetical protein